MTPVLITNCEISEVLADVYFPLQLRPQTEITNSLCSKVVALTGTQKGLVSRYTMLPKTETVYGEFHILKRRRRTVQVIISPNLRTQDRL